MTMTSLAIVVIMTSCGDYDITDLENPTILRGWLINAYKDMSNVSIFNLHMYSLPMIGQCSRNTKPVILTKRDGEKDRQKQIKVMYLNVIVRIPIHVEDDDCVCGCQIDSQTARFG